MMFQSLKRIMAALCVLCLLLSGCSGNKKEEQTKESEKVEITENSVYLVPENPTACMKSAYDELSKALTSGDEKAEAQALAKLFVSDFFTLSNKEADTDVGGLNYVPSDAYEDMEVYARFYFYNNYSVIKTDLGEDQLPTVKEVTVNNTEEASVTYDNQNYDGYKISVEITYEDTKAEDLKESAVLSVIKIDDYDYETLKELNSGELEETPMPKTLMRVIALS